MPYQIKDEGDKFCVYNLDTNKKEGEFDTRDQAMKRMKALYKTEGKREGEPNESAAEDAADGGKK